MNVNWLATCCGHVVTLQVSGGVAIQVQKFQVAQLMPKGTFKGA